MCWWREIAFLPLTRPKEMIRARPTLLELLATWEPLDEEFPEIEDLEPIEDVDLWEDVSGVRPARAESE
jgi:hypothetical protein